jgi:hypothetical protein
VTIIRRQTKDARIGKTAAATFQKGLGQLTLVEHALCPLDCSITASVHRSRFYFVDSERKRRTAAATVAAPFGLLPSDEFFLWGLLGLTFAQPEPTPELYATPHFILRQLSCIDARSDRGGSAYRGFRDSLKRLAAASYHCDGFYDPIRQEHREISFGFLSYSLPIDPASSRAWRIIWDPLFFEYCSGARACLGFDMGVYRRLDPAARRLYLFLAKIFWRHQWTHWIDLRTLAVNVLGFSETIALRNLKQKVKRAVLRLGKFGIVHVSPTAQTRELFIDRDDGESALRLRRGPAFRKVSPRPDFESVRSLPVFEPLCAIGLDENIIGWLAKTYRHNLIQQWADITLAAKDRHGLRFFKKSPQAYFMNNLREAAENGRTPPDWWWACKREEEEQIAAPAAKRLVEQVERLVNRREHAESRSETAFLNHLRGAGRTEFDGLLRRTFADFRQSGVPAEEAHQRATEICVAHLRRRFFSEPAA